MLGEIPRWRGVLSNSGFVRHAETVRVRGILYTCPPMSTELDVLYLVSQRLDACRVQYMLTGSFALAFYATPRMTRDLDLVVQLSEADMKRLAEVFLEDFYLDAEDAATAVAARRMFNLMHLQSGIKVDFIVRKDTEYREVEFSRRKAVQINGLDIWIVSREDLILSKIVWSLESKSDMQRRDIVSLAHPSLDWAYLRRWANNLGISAALEQTLG
ncbi:MAG: nucleotidyl transferase AbiEii/AbiGii toxin family protein [Gammaproteobacteria bacterium]